MLGLILVSLLAGCSTTGGQAAMPSWLNGPAADYPPQRYLLGRGSGPTLALAQDRARADLAKSLRVAIEARSSERQHYRSDESGAAGEVAVDRQLQTHVSEVIEGLAIADIWRDPRSGDYHALAVLERMAAARRLREKIGELDRETASRIAAARRAADPLRAIAHADAALRAQEARGAIQGVLAVLDPAVAGIAPRWSAAALRGDRDALLARLRIAVDRTASDAELAPLLEGAVAAVGLRLATAEETADYRLAARLKLLPVVERDAWFWARGGLSLTLWWPDGRVRGRHRWPLKAAASSAALARERARQEAARLLRAELLQVLLGFADNLCGQAPAAANAVPPCPAN